MNTARWTRGLGLVVTLVLGAAVGQAWADPNPGNDTGQFTVRITPNVDLGGLVDTTGAAWAGDANLDTIMALGTEKLLGTGVKVTVDGNFNKQELQLSGAALNTWTLDVDDADAQDQLRLYGKFGTNAGVSPVSGDFTNTTDLITAANGRAGQLNADEAGDANHKYELPIAHAQYQDVDNMAVAQIRRLWLRANTPTTTSVDGQQQFTVTVTALSGTGN